MYPPPNSQPTNLLIKDTYMGGNPWYINTAAAAEFLYSALYQWSRLGSLAITTTSLPFFRDFLPTVSIGTYGSATSTYLTLTNAIRTYADGYMSLVEKYTPCGGGLAEQFSRSNGAPLSAVDLTWSCKQEIAPTATTLAPDLANAEFRRILPYGHRAPLRLRSRLLGRRQCKLPSLRLLRHFLQRPLRHRYKHPLPA